MEQIVRHKRNRNILRFVRSLPCRACGGTRLRPEALAVTVSGLTIAETAAFSIDELHAFFGNGVRHNFAEQDAAVCERVREQALDRIDVLRRLGLGYLTLDRESTTLAGGEVQRIKLARQAGIGLGGVLYVLDEPTIGLHHRDTGRLLDVLRLIRNRGNTLLVVEHDEQVVRSADWIVDVGPAAGRAGGEVLYCGPASQFVPGDGQATVPPLGASRTRAFLTGAERIPVPDARRPGAGALAVSGFTKHNLRDVAAEFKAGAFNAVTGVSGAGKSTLVEELARLWRAGTVRGADLIDKIIEIDQAPIGRTPRSNPATYTGLFDRVRDLFAAQPEAVRRGFGKGRFSFNVKGGRCEDCEGAGVQQVGMQFLGTVNLVCEACAGRRFSDDTLEVRYRGKDIHDVLEMPIEEAASSSPISRSFIAASRRWSGSASVTSRSASRRRRCRAAKRSE
jgi:excinuclease ABC subunit A